jgi:hypothetical protein
LVKVIYQQRGVEMKKTILVIIATVASLVIATKTGLLSALFILMLTGMVPGTHIIIPANVMLILISAIMCAVLFYPTARDILRIILEKNAIDRKKSSAAHLPKRRFSEI